MNDKKSKKMSMMLFSVFLRYPMKQFLSNVYNWIALTMKYPLQCINKACFALDFNIFLILFYADLFRNYLNLNKISAKLTQAMISTLSIFLYN